MCRFGRRWPLLIFHTVASVVLLVNIFIPPETGDCNCFNYCSIYYVTDVILLTRPHYTFCSNVRPSVSPVMAFFSLLSYGRLMTYAISLLPMFILKTFMQCFTKCTIMVLHSWAQSLIIKISSNAADLCVCLRNFFLFPALISIYPFALLTSPCL